MKGARCPRADRNARTASTPEKAFPLRGLGAQAAFRRLNRTVRQWKIGQYSPGAYCLYHQPIGRLSVAPDVAGRRGRFAGVEEKKVKRQRRNGIDHHGTDGIRLHDARPAKHAGTPRRAAVGLSGKARIALLDTPVRYMKNSVAPIPVMPNTAAALVNPPGGV